MRKFLAVTALAASTVGIGATTAAPAMAATFYRGHFTTYPECKREGDRILWNSPKAQYYNCPAHPALGGFDLYVTY